MASIEIHTKSILEQSHICDDIVENIDKIVPKLYKLRQQVQAQKNYINDMTSSLLNKTTSDSLADVMTVNPQDTPLKINTNNITDINFSTSHFRHVIQSIYKLKHDIGTSYHFNTSQIGDEAHRINGLNLIDVKTITSGLDDYLKLSSTTVNGSHSDDITYKVINKLFAPVAFVEERLLKETDSLTEVKKIKKFTDYGTPSIMLSTDSSSDTVNKEYESSGLFDDGSLQNENPFGQIKTSITITSADHNSLTYDETLVYQSNAVKIADSLFQTSEIKFGFNTSSSNVDDYITFGDSQTPEGNHSFLDRKGDLASDQGISAAALNVLSDNVYPLMGIALDKDGNVKPRRRQIGKQTQIEAFTGMVRGLGLVD